MSDYPASFEVSSIQSTNLKVCRVNGRKVGLLCIREVTTAVDLTASIVCCANHIMFALTSGSLFRRCPTMEECCLVASEHSEVQMILHAIPTL